MAILKNDWEKLLFGEFEKEYYLNLREFLIKEYKYKTIFPNMYDIYNALHYTDYEKTKVVILGQDPYHGKGQAHGLSFSVKPGIAIPPSLINIFKELHDDIGCKTPKHGCLTHWAQQGVLLLNTVLTVREKEPNSHQGIGWEVFTDKIIELLNKREKPLVFILWGKPAQRKKKMIDPKHLIIESVHPSPLSCYRGFFGSKPFSRTNEFLIKNKEEPINWEIPDINDK